jgi:hypothetical protein
VSHYTAAAIWHARDERGLRFPWSLTVTQTNRATVPTCCLAGTWLMLCLPVTVFAHLGGDGTSVHDDGAALSGQLRTTSMLQYDAHELTLPSGTVVHEYVSRSGAVFAISWQGPLPPDLSQLLGTYFPRFTDAASAAIQAQHGLQRQLSSVQPDFVVQSVAHLRSFRGKAYVPALVPEGVAVEQLP